MRCPRQIQFLCFLTLLLICTTGLASVEKKNTDDEIVFGVLPFLSPVAMIKRFSPLKDYLEKVTGKKVYLESAPNFPEYLRRSVAHEYDLVYTSPHYVPLTLKDGYYQLLASTNKVAAHLLVKNSSPIQNFMELAGKRIAHGPDQAFVVIIAKHLLKSNGLVGKKEPIFKQYKSHNAALRSINANEADAAIVGSFLIKQALASGLKQIAKSESYPGIGIMVPKTMPDALKQKIKSAFLDIKNTKEGRLVLQKIKFPGYEKVTPAEYQELIPVVKDAYKLNQ